jgi:hypothetical protein
VYIDNASNLDIVLPELVKIIVAFYMTEFRKWYFYRISIKIDKVKVKGVQYLGLLSTETDIADFYVQFSLVS